MILQHRNKEMCYDYAIEITTVDSLIFMGINFSWIEKKRRFVVYGNSWIADYKNKKLETLFVDFFVI